MANYRGPSKKDRRSFTSMTVVEQMVEQMVEELIPTNVSAFYNDSQYISSVPVTSVNGNTGAVVLSLFSGNYSDLIGKPTLFSGNYSDLSGKPTLFSGAYADLTGKPTLFSGSYLDLTNKPTIPTVRRLETFNGTTDASGNFTVTYSTPYPAVPDVQPQLTAGTASQVVRITSNTVNGFTVNVTNRASVTLLAIEVLLAAPFTGVVAAVSVLVTARS